MTKIMRHVLKHKVIQFVESTVIQFVDSIESVDELLWWRKDVFEVQARPYHWKDNIG